jgi:YtkA-like
MKEPMPDRVSPARPSWQVTALARWCLVMSIPLASAGCSGPSGTEATAEWTVVSDSGALRVTTSTEPAGAMVRGRNAIVFEIVAVSDGAPVDGLDLTMTPFMPSHAHVAPEQPPSASLGQGRYRFDGVVLSMPGLWELRTTVREPSEDHFAPRFEVE